MLPADGVLRAAHRWLCLLERSTLPQASALIRADAAFTDLSPTQYATALDWLSSVGLLEDIAGSRQLSQPARGLPDTAARQLLFVRSLEDLAPAWLLDADTLVRDTSELPQDAAGLAALFGLDDTSALLSIRQVHGRIDLAARARTGAEGERCLVALLEQQWPGSTRHVALTDDGFGYDIAFTQARRTWHLEVKTTTRRGRLVIYLSRHEHEVALLDPEWRLVVVGLSAQGELAALATVRHEALQQRSPHDRDPAARWESTRHQLRPTDLDPGLGILGAPAPGEAASVMHQGHAGAGSSFGWMPTAGLS